MYIYIQWLLDQRERLFLIVLIMHRLLMVSDIVGSFQMGTFLLANFFCYMEVFKKALAGGSATDPHLVPSSLELGGFVFLYMLMKHTFKNSKKFGKNSKICSNNF